MRRTLLLHVGDDLPLRTSRSAILRSHFEVIDCLTREAHAIFMAQPHVDAVVLCGSVTGAMQKLLVNRIRQHAPQTLILQMGFDSRIHAANTVLIDPHAPHRLVAAIGAALVEHTPGHALGVSAPARHAPMSRTTPEG